MYPNEHQKKALLETMERFNEACNFISKTASYTHTFGKIGLQKIVYYDVREKYNLSAQMVVRAIGKVAESYRVDNSCCHEFKKHGAIVYDQRILTFKTSDEISILTLEGRERITIKYGGISPS